MLNGLAADDWRRLRAFTGESSLATYIAAAGGGAWSVDGARSKGR